MLAPYAPRFRRPFALIHYVSNVSVRRTGAESCRRLNTESEAPSVARLEPQEEEESKEGVDDR